MRDHVGDYDSQFAAIKAVAARLEMSTEALRRWARQAEVGAGQAVGVTSESAKEIRSSSGRTPSSIAPRTYWAWAKRAPSKRALSDLVLTEVIAGLYEPDEHSNP